MSTDVACPSPRGARRRPVPSRRSGWVARPAAAARRARRARRRDHLARCSRATTGPAPFPPSSPTPRLTILPINLSRSWLVRRALHREGQPRPRPHRLLVATPRHRRAVGAALARRAVRCRSPSRWSACWSRSRASACSSSFDTIFYDADVEPPPDRTLLTVHRGRHRGHVRAAERARPRSCVYRGYSQGGLQRHRWPAFWAIVVPAAIFGVQHVFFAATRRRSCSPTSRRSSCGASVPGLIVWWQRRLMPIIVAHFLTNLFTSAPALVLVFLPAEAFTGLSRVAASDRMSGFARANRPVGCPAPRDGMEHDP